MQKMLDMHMHEMHHGDMTLKDFLTANNLTDAAFGESIGVSQSQISRIKRGVSKPSFDVLVAIEEATSGKVMAKDIVGAGEPVSEDAA